MKKLFLLLFSVLVLYKTAAQNTTFGVKGGMNFSTIATNIESPFDYNYKAGFQIGGFIRFRITDKLFLQPELLYILQGAKFDLNIASVSLPQTSGDIIFDEKITGIKSNESNLILPVMLKYYFNENISFQIGPQFDYLFNIKADNIEIDNGIIVKNGKNSESVSEFNWGLNFGAGYDFNEKIGIELRYNYGFNRNNLNDISNRFGSSVFQFNLEYRFN
jgi:hypothetical protein